MEPLFEKVPEVIERARQAGIVFAVVIGINPETNRRALELSDRYPNFLAPAVGFHPHEVAKVTEEDYKKLEEGLKKACALGEIGLDWVKEYTPKGLQFEHLERLLDLAKRQEKPVILHFRGDEAFWREGIDFLKSWQGLKFLFHCFTGSKEELKRVINELDAFVSIPGIVTFKKAEALREAVRECPLERLLLETDSPFLAPEPYRGKVNEPAFLIHTAKKVAELKGLSLEELSQITTQNAIKFFNLQTFI
jgi:TatD DNase family protein